MSAFLETLIGGLLAGTMYSLVAIGFVLIYKASGVFNYAQGSLLLFAALTFATLTDQGAPFIVALAVTIAALVVVAVAIERLLLRPLANRSPMTLFMATLGLSYIVEGTAQGVMGSQIRALDIGLEDRPIFLGDILISQFDLVAAGVAVVLVGALSLMFDRTRIGISLRAVADDTRAALSIGVDINHIWRIVWAVAGLVGLVAGLLWGSRQGVQFSLSLVVLKALPVLIIGGFTSIIGSIVGGLIVGAAEALAETYLGPLLGGGITPWFAYVLALIFLFIRPAGLFGERQIERV
ncbi:branched-chain amino acid ABC transporter permease [Rhodoblastus sphagnicola]|uniref:Branched-chain amino acid ABC transporter permease n=1 Tax=Rhodoblastus sphagnicola TaxID=333368 RepID=A0A2S6NGU3_9HYPH|nr:branched-chain amino acid ABC transporter permease [Rhodoblastus sphagnicola]MBB4201021.1 branched-chain amino acid transport system permease protein [Rhodoblastus sphagnicola]PPQ33848.1 branched-chain amino acid ABC transporter permease [Rhodoblastus sphagnicola]